MKIELPPGVTHPQIVSEWGHLESVFSFRYKVYVEEMHRPQYAADHVGRKIRDNLDDTGFNLACFSGQEVVGVARVNLARDGNLGDYEKLYGLSDWTDRLQHCAIVTRLMIKQELRRTTLAFFLAKECYEFGLGNSVRHCFIDCNLPLEAFFHRLGFTPFPSRVQHPEYGEIMPMRLDLHDIDYLEKIRSPFSLIYRELTLKKG